MAHFVGRLCRKVVFAGFRRSDSDSLTKEYRFGRKRETLFSGSKPSCKSFIKICACRAPPFPLNLLTLSAGGGQNPLNPGGRFTAPLGPSYIFFFMGRLILFFPALTLFKAASALEP